MYGDKYGYDNGYQTKKTNVNILKIKCVNSNINVNGIYITQIPQPNDLGATAETTNEDGVANTQQNGNGLDKINFNRNLANVCVNANFNQQIGVKPIPEPIPVNLDLAVANVFDHDVPILLGHGNGGFVEATGSPFMVGDRPQSVAVGDFNSN